MSSDYIQDLIDHKQRVAGYMLRVISELYKVAYKPELVVLPQFLDFHDLLPDLTLINFTAIACMTKHYGSCEIAHLPPSWSYLSNTLRYLDQYTCEKATDWIGKVIADLAFRASVHDNSKFSPEEFDLYEAAYPELQKHAYGSPEYKAATAKLGPAWKHHCAVNDHHPEYFKQGVADMHFIQASEMLCDWLAASDRSQTPFSVGLAMNKVKFSLDDDFLKMLTNTVKLIAPDK